MRPAQVLLVLLLVAAAGSTVAVIFVAGSPVAEERPGLTGPAGGEPSGAGAEGGKSGASGRAPAPPADPGRTRVAEASGADAADPAAIASGRVRGRVTTVSGVAAPARFELVVEGEDAVAGSRVLAFEGDVRLVTLDLPPGRSVLRARAPGLASRPTTIERVEGRPVAPFELALEPAGGLTGRIVDAAGEPLGGMPVMLSGRSRDAREVATDAGGRFEIADLPAGDYQLSLGAAKSPLAPPVAATVAAGEVREVETPRLPELGEAEVFVKDGRGAPLAGARVTGRGQLGGAFEAVTDGAGRVRARFLPLGPLYLEVVDAAGRRASASLEIERGRAAATTIAFPGG